LNALFLRPTALFKLSPATHAEVFTWSIQEPAKQPAMMKKIEIIDLSLEG
jgi:hypothetical protein